MDKLLESVNAWTLKMPNSDEREPGTLEEVDETIAALEELRDAEPAQAEAEFAANVQERLNYATHKKFTGFWLMLIVVGVFWCWMLKENVADIGFTYTLEQAQKDISTNMDYYQKQLTDRTALPEADPNRANGIRIYTKLLEETKADAENPEDYRSSKVWRTRRSGMSGMIFDLIMLGFVGLYVWTSFIPQFVVDRRRKEAAVANASRKIISRVLFGLLTMFFSMDWFYTVRTHWSDGSKSDDTGINPMLIVMIFVCLVVVFFMVMIMIYALPIIALINLVRNRKYLLKGKALEVFSFMDRQPIFAKMGL
ncbi:MAG: hypothetical protein WC360_04315 [Opitutales bacterium]